MFLFTGPNKKNWDEIMGANGVQSDTNGELTREVLKILSNKEVLNSVATATSLYVPLSEMAGLYCITAYVSMPNRPLCELEVDRAVQKGRGSPLWLKCVEDLRILLLSIEALMKRVPSSRQNPMIPISTLEQRVKTLSGYSSLELSDDNVEELVESISMISTLEKKTHVGLANYLVSRMVSIKRIQLSAYEANENIIRLRNEKKLNVMKDNQRIKSGITFQDDPVRDKDYLNTSVVPFATELISAPPRALPKNICLSLARVGEFCVQDEDDVEGMNKDTKVSDTDGIVSYRSSHHYLNTHFQLNREDSLAQIRRGIHSLREQLVVNNDSFSNNITRACNAPIPVPTLHKLNRVIDLLSRNRNGNDRIYIYGNVTVECIERMRDDVGYCISFNVTHTCQIDWANSQRFMNGSLLCLSSDGTFNESSLVVATVLQGVNPPKGGAGLKGWIPTVTISIDRDSISRFNPMDTFVMVESMVFFDAYRPVLEAIKKIGKYGDLPFEKNLLGKSTSVSVRKLNLSRYDY